MALPNDRYYIDRIMEGDSQAFAPLVDRYKNLVYTLALRMIKNTEEAEEAAQDTFIKVFRSIEKFKGESKFSTWIYRIAYNTCLDRIKKHKSVPLAVAIDDYGTHQLRSAENVLDTLDEEERHRAMQECLQQLPGEDAFLLTLYYFEEQSLEEIAKVIGIKANNVKIKLFRSRKKLGEILRAKLEPEIISEYERERK